MARCIGALVTVAVAAVGMGACNAGTQTVASAGPLVVAVDLPLQGPKKAVHEETVNALKLYLEQAGGKVGGRSVELKVYDNATPAKGAWDADTCKKNATAHVANVREVAVIGPVNSGCTTLMIPIHNADPTGPLLQISHASTTVGLTKADGPGEPEKYYPSAKRNFGRTVTNDEVQGAANAQFVIKTLGVKRCFVINDGEAYGKGLARIFAAEARKLGIEVIGELTWDKKAASYTPLFQPAKAANPDCVFLAGIVDNNGIELVKDKHRILGDNNAVKLLAPQGFSGSSELAATHEAQGMYVTFAGIASADVRGRNGPGAAFLDSYKERYGAATQSTYVITAIQALQVILKAIETSDGTRAGVRKAVFEGNGVTVSSQASVVGRDIKIDPKTGDTNLRDISVFRVTDNKESFYRIWVLS